MELGYKRSMAPGILAAWRGPETRPVTMLKEVLAIIRPERWHQTKIRLQRLRLLACTHHRVLGRGRERGLRYLPRQQAANHAGMRYLPKRLISWVVEDAQVEAVVNAIIEVNRTGRMGDGRIFILPVEEAVRVRTRDRGVAALRSEHIGDMVMGTTHATWQ